ncbi:hypothetical protein [Erythrobacter sp. HKB08]|uniref:hypothetical protein n=1 Tax=Erythrobacter sp. HKB08 TaxID=2502843 RepID=UPI0010089C1E|nr:hypothetical protein [Erythrobacter sp. HKB08]
MRAAAREEAYRTAVIDYFALAMTHALILIALVRLVGRAELDEDPDLDDRHRPVRRSKAGEGGEDA